MAQGILLDIQGCSKQTQILGADMVVLFPKDSSLIHNPRFIAETGTDRIAAGENVQEVKLLRGRIVGFRV